MIYLTKNIFLCSFSFSSTLKITQTSYIISMKGKFYNVVVLWPGKSLLSTTDTFNTTPIVSEAWRNFPLLPVRTAGVKITARAPNKSRGANKLSYRYRSADIDCTYEYLFSQYWSGASTEGETLLVISFWLVWFKGVGTHSVTMSPSTEIDSQQKG